MKAVIDIPKTKVASTVIELPISSEYIGQRVEIVYEIHRVPKEEKKVHFSNFGLEEKKQIKYTATKGTKRLLPPHINTNGWKFNREEANER
jgi:hypothetical protein